jgi:hypothetical protein
MQSSMLFYYLLYLVELQQLLDLEFTQTLPNHEIEADVFCPNLCNINLDNICNIP